MRLKQICTSKIHRATVTHTDVDYIGSIAIDEDLIRRVNIVPGERVCLWNVNNGERIETYALPAPAGSGHVIINGAAARRFQRGDVVIIAAFTLSDEPIQPRMILVDSRNRYVEELVDNRWPHMGGDATPAELANG